MTSPERSPWALAHCCLVNPAMPMPDVRTVICTGGPQQSLRSQPIRSVAAEIALLRDRIGGEEERRPGSRLRTID
jgi:hypothetical protein